MIQSSNATRKRPEFYAANCCRAVHVEKICSTNLEESLSNRELPERPYNSMQNQYRVKWQNSITLAVSVCNKAYCSFTTKPYPIPFKVSEGNPIHV